MYTYPDIAIACRKPEFEDFKDDILLNAIAIIEVLFPSIENYDRGTKFEHYQTIDSLSDYILVAQEKIHVEN